ncbi:OmpA family protein [Paraflavisolibacter sp. H34]|uniref:OmpA/MotB family protein n=1 Tax=Huijunlia imazamoxiresistens TaxID=3127457 RepID=UPI0030191D1F
MDEQNNDYFWPSYVDFMMVLFFIALGLGGYMFLEYNNKIKAGRKYETLVKEVIRINESLKNEFERNHLQIDFSNKEKIKLKGDFYFETASYELKSDEAVRNIRAIGRSFKKVLDADSNFAKYSILVEGHTDDVADDDYNNILSYNRALCITRIWSEGYGFQLPRYDIIASGFGERKPVADNITPAHRALNRRIEISIIPKLSEFTKRLQD